MKPREKAKVELVEDLRKLFPGLVFVPDGDSLQAVNGDLSGTARLASRSDLVFQVEIRAGDTLLVSRWWSPNAEYRGLVKAEHRGLAKLHRTLGVLLGVSDG